MADNSSSNGDIKFNVSSGGMNNSGVGESTQQDYSTMKSDSGGMEMETGTMSTEKAGDYVRELLQEKQSLDSSQWPNALRLLDQGMIVMLLNYYSWVNVNVITVDNIKVILRPIYVKPVPPVASVWM